MILCLLSLVTYAEMKTCPDPKSTSLKWGQPPKPWEVNPYSPNRPQIDENTKFVRANILVAGMGQGVACTYQTSTGLYSIWWQVRVMIPAREDYNWIYSLGGFVCAGSLKDCQFSIAE
nr:DUF3757 domain-containing protein [Legionella micdadei]